MNEKEITSTSTNEKEVPAEQPTWQDVAEQMSEWHPDLQEHARRELSKRGISLLTRSDDDLLGAEFLHKRDTNLHHTREIEDVSAYLRRGGASIPNAPGEKIAAYVDFLASPEHVNDGILTGDRASIERQVDAAIIQVDAVPESYFELQQRLAHERGHEHMDLTEETRQQLAEVLRDDQSESLGTWAYYLTDAMSEHNFPRWFKQYTWESVMKLGALDTETAVFARRSRTTTAPFPELNAEALAAVYDDLRSYYVDGDRAGVSSTDALVEGGQFAKLYGHHVAELTAASKEMLNTVEGSWTRYEQIEGEYEPNYAVDPQDKEAIDQVDVNNETAMRLATSLQGHHTGWCTAGTSTAAHQLSQGDFYVYYSRDDEGNDTIPRVVIRMAYGQVAEVRGIDPWQSLEVAVAEVTESKLIELPGGEQYFDKLANTRRLSAIEANLAADIPMSPEDLFWLRYGDIDTFSQWGDPRRDDLLTDRDERDDVDLFIRSWGIEKTAQRLIDANLLDVLVSNIDAFPTLTINIARQLMDTYRSHRRALYQNLDKLSELDAAEVVKEMLYDYDDAYPFAMFPEISIALTSVQKLNVSVARRLTEKGFGGLVEAHLDKFPTLDPAELARMLLESGHIENLLVLTDRLDKFPTADRDRLAQRLLERPETYDVLRFNIDKFPNIDRETLAAFLAEARHGALHYDDQDVSTPPKKRESSRILRWLRSR